jgi:hypothetical protein
MCRYFTDITEELRLNLVSEIYAKFTQSNAVLFISPIRPTHTGQFEGYTFSQDRAIAQNLLQDIKYSPKIQTFYTQIRSCGIHLTSVQRHYALLNEQHPAPFR